MKEAAAAERLLQLLLEGPVGLGGVVVMLVVQEAWCRCRQQLQEAVEVVLHRSRHRSALEVLAQAAEAVQATQQRSHLRPLEQQELEEAEEEHLQLSCPL